jgi:hypothetical protein
VRINAKPDGVVNSIDRALWMTPPFDMAFGLLAAPPRPKVRRVSDTDKYSEVWREPHGIQRVSYGMAENKRELAICSAESGPAMPPVPPDDSRYYAIRIVNGVMTWVEVAW